MYREKVIFYLEYVDICIYVKTEQPDEKINTYKYLVISQELKNVRDIME